jgi:hypothetical protein
MEISVRPPRFSAIPLLGLKPIGGLQGLNEFLQGWFILNQFQQTAEVAMTSEVMLRRGAAAGGTPGLVRHNVFLR